MTHPDVLRFLCGTVMEGLNFPDSQLAAQCCSALDCLLTYAITSKFKVRPDPAAAAMLDLIQASESIFAKAITSTPQLSNR